jgi:hypothetical protein
MQAREVGQIGMYIHRTSINQSIRVLCCCNPSFFATRQQHGALSVHFRRPKKISQEGKIRLQHLTFTAKFRPGRVLKIQRKKSKAGL